MTDKQNIFKLTSGFTVRVRTLGPYALDPVLDQYRDLGEFTFAVKLLAGDEVNWLYEPPDELPDPDNQEDYELYRTWQAWQHRRMQIAEDRERARRDFVMTNCFEIVDGPCVIDDDDWLNRSSVTVPTPESYGERLLLFLKTQVVSTLNEWEALLKLAVAPEVTMEGILNAFRTFRRDLGRDGNGGGVEDTAPVEGTAQHKAVGG